MNWFGKLVDFTAAQKVQWKSIWIWIACGELAGAEPVSRLAGKKESCNVQPLAEGMLGYFLLYVTCFINVYDLCLERKLTYTSNDCLHFCINHNTPLWQASKRRIAQSHSSGTWPILWRQRSSIIFKNKTNSSAYWTWMSFWKGLQANKSKCMLVFMLQSGFPPSSSADCPFSSLIIIRLIPTCERASFLLSFYVFDGSLFSK